MPMAHLKHLALTDEDAAIFERLRRTRFKLRHFYYHTDLKAYVHILEKVRIKSYYGTSYATWLTAKYKRWHNKPHGLNSSAHM